MTPTVGLAAACEALGVARASLSRHRQPQAAVPNPQPRAAPPRPLSPGERHVVLEVLHSERFGAIEHARSFCHHVFTWDTTEHHHTALALLTPEMVRYHRAPEVLKARQRVLLEAYRAHPDRFVRRPPPPLALPEAVWINSPLPNALSQKERHCNA